MASGESGRRREAESPRSTLMFCAQTRSYEQKLGRKTPIRNGMNKMITGIFTSMPDYKTPVRKEKAKNPFVEKPHQFLGPVSSPDLFATIISPSEESKSGDFFWTIDDVSRINPVVIDSPETEDYNVVNEKIESMTQEALERYFEESHRIESPLAEVDISTNKDESRIDFVTNRAESSEIELSVSPISHAWTNKITPNSMALPPYIVDRAMSTPRISKTNNCATQTLLSFPVHLPDELLEVLKPYLSSDEADISSGLCNTSSYTSLRRKLFFSELAESPIKSDDEVKESENKTRFSPSDWTPDKVIQTHSMRSPSLSPIKNIKADINFTEDMIIDSQSFINQGSDSVGMMSIDISSNRKSEGDTGYMTTEDSAKGANNLATSYECINNKKNTGIASTPASKYCL